MGAALVLLLVGLGAMAAGVLIGRYYVPDDRHLRRTARHSKAYMRALSHLIARDHETVVSELRGVVEENVDDVEPYFALGAMFRSRGEHERAIRVHQALALRERDKRKLRQRAMYELGLDFRAAGMPRRATRAMEEVLVEEPNHDSALRVLAALYEEQARFNEAAGLWQRLGKHRNEDTGPREHHLLVAAAQAALGRDDVDSAKQLLKAAAKHEESAHYLAAAAELAAAKGNHRGAVERLKQALIADPGLAPHLLPGLVAAETELAADRRPAAARRRDEEDDDEEDDDEPKAKPRLGEGGAKQLEAGGSVEPIPDPALVRIPDPSAELIAISEASAGAMTSTSSTTITGPNPGPGPGPGPGPVPVPSPVPSPVPVPVPSPTPGPVPVPSPSPGPVPVPNPTATPPLGIAVLSADAAALAAVLALLTEVETQTGPRLELSLIRAQLVPAADGAGRAALAKELAARFPEALAARVATARLALAGGDAAAVRANLELFVADAGSLAWTLRGRWQCAQCGHRPGPFSWRCGQCRRWSSLRMETGIEPPPAPSRERRAAPRIARPEGLLGTAPDDALPAPTLDPGLSDDELARAGTRRSLLGRVGGWFSGAWRRDRR